MGVLKTSVVKQFVWGECTKEREHKRTPPGTTIMTLRCEEEGFFYCALKSSSKCLQSLSLKHPCFKW